MAGADALVMTTLRMLSLALLGEAACVTADADSVVSTDDRTLSDNGAYAEASDEPSEEYPDICPLLPPCGICSHACDPGGLSAYVTPGTCAAIVCTLTDGRRVTIHACQR